MFRILSNLLLFAFTVACNEEPVLQAIDAPNVLNDVPSADERLQQPQQQAYVKRDSVYIDVLHLGGLDWQLQQTVLNNQLGSLQQSTELPMQQGVEHIYDRGTIYVYDGRIYRLDIPLPEHMRRSEALLTLGFPEQVDKYLITHREYVLENEWAFRRLRMMRVSKENELVTMVSAWKFYPQEL